MKPLSRISSTPPQTSYPLGAWGVEDGCAFHWEPYSLNPTIITAKGIVAQLVSRDCCPCLDDYETNYCPAVSVVTQANEDKRVKISVTWDPAGPTFDEPKTLRKKRVRPPGRHPLSDFNSDSDVNSDDDYSAPAREAWS